MSKTIAILGSGYVGVSTAAVAANAGYTVHLIDIDQHRIEVLKQGRSFFYEEGIDPLLKQGVDHGTIIPSTNYSPGVTEADIIISSVGTPDNPDGSSNLSYIYESAKTAAKLMKKDAIFVQKSTVPVGTGQEVKKLLPKDTRYVSNPEFLREAKAVIDTLNFDRIVVGGDDKKALLEVIDVYKNIEKNRNAIHELSGLSEPLLESTGQYIATTLESAELIKVTANSFLALKISYANNIAKLADAVGADVNGVMDGVGADARIGRAFLNAGRGYGGGCFPKDVSGLISSASSFGVDIPILTAAQDINQSMPGYIVNKLQNQLRELDGKRVAVLGLAFKAGTSDARKSPGVTIANMLDKNGVDVTAYDPQANNEAKEDLRRDIKVMESAIDAARDSDAVVIATDWPEFNELPVKLNRCVVVDAMNMFKPNDFSDTITYIGVGR